MTDIPRPDPGDSDWIDWATDEEATSDQIHAATAAATPDTLVKRDAAGRFAAADGVAATDVATKGQLDSMAEDSGSYWASTTKSLADTTLSADSDLNVPIAASERMWLDWYFVFTSAAGVNTDLKATLTVPTGATGLWGSALDYDAPGSSGTQRGVLTDLTTTKTFALNDGPTGVHIRALVINGATAGNIVINLAQNTANATAVIREAWPKVAYDKVQG